MSGRATRCRTKHDVTRRLADASVRMIELRNELDTLQADLAWLQLAAAGGPDLLDDQEQA